MRRKRQIILLIVFGVLFLASVICFALYRRCGRVLETQKTAQVWQGGSEMKFAQVSAFFPSEAEFGQTDVYAFREKLTKSFEEASL